MSAVAVSDQAPPSGRGQERRHTTGGKPRNLNGPGIRPLDVVYETLSPRCTLDTVDAAVVCFFVLLADNATGQIGRVSPALVGKAIRKGRTTVFAAWSRLERRGIIRRSPRETDDHDPDFSYFEFTMRWEGLYTPAEKAPRKAPPSRPKSERTPGPGLAKGRPDSERSLSALPDLPCNPLPASTPTTPAPELPTVEDSPPSGVARRIVENSGGPPESSAPSRPAYPPPPLPTVADDARHLLAKMQSLPELRPIASPELAAQLATEAHTAGLALARTVAALVKLDHHAGDARRDQRAWPQARTRNATHRYIATEAERWRPLTPEEQARKEAGERAIRAHLARQCADRESQREAEKTSHATQLAKGATLLAQRLAELATKDHGSGPFQPLAPPPPRVRDIIPATAERRRAEKQLIAELEAEEQSRPRCNAYGEEQ